jgi:hypothetical protein
MEQQSGEANKKTSTLHLVFPLPEVLKPGTSNSKWVLTNSTQRLRRNIQQVKLPPPTALTLNFAVLLHSPNGLFEFK